MDTKHAFKANSQYSCKRSEYIRFARGRKQVAVQSTVQHSIRLDLIILQTGNFPKEFK